MELYNFFSSANGQAANIIAKKDFSDFPPTFDNIWILGKKYHALHDLEDLRAIVRSKIWFSYRSGFPAIGGTGPKTDKYWGCMLRCAQMVMAEALICRHLGRGWVWNSLDPVYAEILKMFQDRKDCPYSIHQIAQMGVSEGKAIGQWFGPNTAAQVLRKLCVYDVWSSIAVHVASDSTVIKSDIRNLCRYQPPPPTPSPYLKSYQTVWYTDCASQKCPRWQAVSATSTDSSSWRPMLLFIPLRLGLATFNPIYSKSLKDTFTMKQSVGILGGRPRHAVWYIGYTGNEFICLDPHVTQSTVNLEDKFDDSSYHLPLGGSKRMPFSEIDPSIALCFYLESEADFEDWCQQVKNIIVPQKQPLFELIDDRPIHFPPLEMRPDLDCNNCSLEYFFVEQESNGDISDEDFEKLESLVCYSNTNNT